MLIADKFVEHDLSIKTGKLGTCKKLELLMIDSKLRTALYKCHQSFKRKSYENKEVHSAADRHHGS